MVRFLHTADWQLGMRRHYLSDEARPRYEQARIDAVATLGRIAKERGCEFVVVAGDVFESNQVSRRTLLRALEALAEVCVPVYLLPGNHDPLDAGSLYRSDDFLHGKPDHLFVLDSTEPVEVRPGVEIVGIAWLSKEMRRDLVGEAIARLGPAGANLRICVAHGNVMPPHARIERDALDRAIEERRVHFVALGDRHSTTEVAERIWYAGTPEPTAHRETDSGQALVVELTEKECTVEPCATAAWSFLERDRELTSPADVDDLANWLSELPAKDCTVLRLRFRGALGLRARARLDAVLSTNADIFACVDERAEELCVLPDDLSDLGLTGFARAAADRLAADGSRPARDALALLYRLAGGGA